MGRAGQVWLRGDHGRDTPRCQAPSPQYTGRDVSPSAWSPPARGALPGTRRRKEIESPLTAGGREGPPPPSQASFCSKRPYRQVSKERHRCDFLGRNGSTRSGLPLSACDGEAGRESHAGVSAGREGMTEGEYTSFFCLCAPMFVGH